MNKNTMKELQVAKAMTPMKKAVFTWGNQTIEAEDSPTSLLAVIR